MDRPSDNLLSRLERASPVAAARMPAARLRELEAEQIVSAQNSRRWIRLLPDRGGHLPPFVLRPVVWESFVGITSDAELEAAMHQSPQQYPQPAIPPLQFN